MAGHAKLYCCAPPTLIAEVTDLARLLLAFQRQDLRRAGQHAITYRAHTLTKIN
ncbi:hypothetical protein CBM2626_B60090 [Cupriavidus taiwanensis]|nr:hypothetical protein CBM2626_B60090 [Cupriavidus taiwanensis]